MTVAIAFLALATIGALLCVVHNAQRRTARISEDSYRSGYADGRRHARGDANEDFFNARGVTR